ncbi:hypothetical protein B0H13DRAFT_1665854 [Mycena leptocephala]|nr:hypothetical protein B0H13DRAFT_2471192 [Mycena leptocephala]KAJ7812953.1 hypothetical protein B0H13DRAFT_1665854 [Mycena leptocephala]
MPKAARKTKKKTPTVTAETLKKKKDAIQDEFSKATNTKTAYKGYRDRGIAIIADVVATRKQKEKEDPSWKCPDGIDTDLLEKALKGPPNKHSVYALGLYLTQKCAVEDLGKSTAEGIHGAFANYWDNLPGSGGKYSGSYLYDEETEKVRGNPARSPEIESFVKCIKNKARKKGAAATRRHAEAMTIEDMRNIFKWSESECPSQKLESKPASLEERILMIKHGMMRGFLSSGYTLWTRNFETCQIQERDLSNGRGPSPYYLPFLGVFLDNRKGWQKKQGYDGPLESNHYDIYEQKDTPEIDMFTHVGRWRKLYRQLLGRDPEPDDYLFPFISPNGMIHSKRPIPHDTAQDLINEFALGAKIDKIFTTHCVRRGGSQYRFMFAPIGKRWSLSIIRWWGGWAAGEQVDTLMRYLLDSLQSYESGHGDALYPFRTEPDKSFMGDHNIVQPPTTAEFRLLGEQILTKLEGLATQTITPSSIEALAAIQQTSICYAPGAQATLISSISSSQTIFPTARGWTDLDCRQPLPQVSPTTEGDPPNTPESANTASNGSSKGLIPIPDAIIPGVGKDARSWKRAITQWYDGDTSKGLTKPLSEWPDEWHTGDMRLFTGTLYSQRKLLAEEYERYVFSTHPWLQSK